MKRILNWCKMMFTQKSGRVHLGRQMQETPEIISSAPNVHLKEDTIFLSRRESAFIREELRRFLKAKAAEEERRKKGKIPPPPAPGRITYAVYY